MYAAIDTDAVAHTLQHADQNSGKIPGYLAKIDGRHYMTDWHGQIIGNARIVAMWRIESAYSSTMHQIEATINGTTYTGRGMGEGMAWIGRPKKTR